MFLFCDIVGKTNMLEKGEEMWYNITEGKRSGGGEKVVCELNVIDFKHRVARRLHDSNIV